MASVDVLQFDDLSHKSSGSSINTNQTSMVTPVVGSLENLAGGEVLRRTSTASLPSPAPLKSTLNRTVDEWEQKLYGKQGKGKIVCTICYAVECLRIHNVSLFLFTTIPLNTTVIFAWSLPAHCTVSQNFCAQTKLCCVPLPCDHSLIQVE